MQGVRLGIDLGTSMVRIATETHGIVLREPSVIAINSKTGKLVAVGKEAEDMIDREPASIKIIRPIQKGTVSDYDCTEMMLHELISRVCAYRIFKPRAAINIPSLVTEVEERSIVQAAASVGVRRTALIQSHIAAALGSGLDISDPHGCMIVDIGAGTTEAAVLSIGGIVASKSVRVGGNDMDDAIIRGVHNRYMHIIGKKTAEEIKKSLATAYPEDEEMEIRGRDALTGLPGVKTISATDVREFIEEQMESIRNTVQFVLETTPPEMASDVMSDGIMLTGGVSQMKGMLDYLERETGVPCRLAENPEDCVAIGTRLAVRNLKRPVADIYDVNPFSYDRSDWMEV
ncbi:MAG: rod shape-determining protein [Clostridia bacterium]|nr:rod shape-determining protein [Clostridia bacterium]